MAQHATTPSFFVDIQQLVERLKAAAKTAGKDWTILSKPLSSSTTPTDRGQAVVELFYQLMWPFGAPLPRLYFDPRTAAKFNAVSLHAKNFTGRGQTRNFEAGVSIEDRAFAVALERQWENLVEAGVLIGGACR